MKKDLFAIDWADFRSNGPLILSLPNNMTMHEKIKIEQLAVGMHPFIKVSANTKDNVGAKYLGK